MLNAPPHQSVKWSLSPQTLYLPSTQVPTSQISNSCITGILDSMFWLSANGQSAIVSKGIKNNLKQDTPITEMRYSEASDVVILNDSANKVELDANGIA